MIYASSVIEYFMISCDYVCFKQVGCFTNTSGKAKSL